MTTKTESKTTALATMWASELHRVLSDAAVFASHDETIPALCMVHVEYTGTRMLAVATDRFRLGVSKADFDKQGLDNQPEYAEATFNLALRDVVSLIKLSKTSKRDMRSRFVWVSQNGDGAVRDDDSRVGTVTFKFSDGAALDVTPQDTEFPKWRQLFPETGTQVPRDATAMNAAYLASFAKVDGGFSGQRVVLYSHDDIHGYRDKPEKPVVDRLYGSQKPTTFAIGDNFVGLLMPVKLVDDGQREWVKPEWMD
jgi:hypothetical protein